MIVDRSLGKQKQNIGRSEISEIIEFQIELQIGTFILLALRHHFRKLAFGTGSIPTVLYPDITVH